MLDRLSSMKKMEIIVSGNCAGLIKDIITSSGGTGYTMIENVSGMGHGGFHQGRLLFNEVSSQIMFIVVAPSNVVNSILDALDDHFAKHTGVAFVSDVQVMRAGYFSDKSENKAST